MTFREFLQQNSIAFVTRTNSGNGLNFRTASGLQVGTVILNNETPVEEDILSWVKDHMTFNCRVAGNFITLSEVKQGVSITALFEESDKPVKTKRRVKA